MDEQSHKDEMRAALRGDFERLRARRGETPPRAALEPAPRLVGSAGAAVPGDPPAVERGRRGWVTRMLGRGF